MTKIIGQEKLVTDIRKILTIFEASEAFIRPHFVLTGPSGSGKSFTIETLCKESGLNYFELNAAQLTKEGTSGNSLSKALSPLLQLGTKPTVCFVDEFDKLFISGNSNSDLAHESTNGVQNEFLKVLESDVTSIFGDYGKYINIASTHVLFIFAGAFNNEEDITIDRLRQLGLKTEFLGRVGLVYNAEVLPIEALYQILEGSSLLDYYLKLFADVKREDVIDTIKAKIAENYQFNTLGARMVNTLINQYFITGGLKDHKVKEVTFQSKLTLETV